MDFAERKQIMLEYLKLKLAEEDFHGIADAAMDLRDIASEKLGYERALADQKPTTFYRTAAGHAKNTVTPWDVIGENPGDTLRHGLTPNRESSFSGPLTPPKNPVGV